MAHFPDKPGDRELLERNGWTLDCMSPFELSHDESESVATGWAAEIVMEYLRENPDAWSGE